MPPAPAPTRRRKRPRRNHESPPSRARRPPPPPPPPPALVQLLRRDPTVLAYFESLQASLGADVQVWRDRAQAWQRDNERLRAGAGSANETTTNGKKKNGTTEKPAGRTTQTSNPHGETASQQSEEKGSFSSVTSSSSSGKRCQAASRIGCSSSRRSETFRFGETASRKRTDRRFHVGFAFLE